MKATYFVRSGSWILGAFLCSSGAIAKDAEVVLLVGKAEVRESSAANWQPVAVQQKIPAGASVRTGDSSQMALLLSDQTQLRVNQQTSLEIKYVGDQKEGTALDLLRGRVWAQVKRAFYSVKTAIAPSQMVSFRAPTATIGIRGTDWDLEVGANGETRLTVLSGQAEMSNEFGQIFVGPNEQAVAEKGKAPVKRILSNARDRVQWVTAYRPAPTRWVRQPGAELRGPIQAINAGDFSAALRELEPLAGSSSDAALLRADLLLFFGQADEAIKALAPYSRDGQGDSRAVALHARALAISGRLDDARALLIVAARTHPGDVEISLALADVARLQGDAEEALALFRGIAAKEPPRDDAWFGIGRIESEKENLRAARQAMNEAVRLAPDVAGYHGERATIEVHAGNREAARRAFDEALRRQPDDYVAWTGLGMLQLKTGETEAALQSFLKAGVLEPRFARAHVYTAVAYYRLENRFRAVESLRKAIELDAKDPLPHIMLGLIHGDALELSEATDAAKAAQARMPYLKSLNQLLNNQKGSANVGASLAAQGLEEWARAYATDSYSVFWAGSPLFLSDRYADGFNKNSELFKGYLLDPLSFGSSNRYSSLVSTPGYYGSLGYQGTRADFTQHSVQGRLNGLTGSDVPVAFSLVGEGADGKDTRTDSSTFDARGKNVVLGVGAKPSFETSVFYFSTGTDVDGQFTDPAVLPDAKLDVTTWRQDGGVGYRFNATNQILLKVGSGKQKTRLAGRQYDPANAASLTIGSALVTSPDAQLDRNDVDADQKDVQFRHAVEFGKATRVTWGYEHGRDDLMLRRAQTYSATMPTCLTFVPLALTPSGCVPVPLLDSLAEQDSKSTTGYLSLVHAFGSVLDVQVDAYFQRTRINALVRQDAQVVDRRSGGGADILPRVTVTQVEEEHAFDDVNHRVGARWSITPQTKLRAAYQRWRRPIGAGSLSPTETVGIPVEDRLVSSGGQLRHYALRFDQELGGNMFFQILADQKRIGNVGTSADPFFKEFGLTELAALKSRKAVFDEPFDEWEKTPEFGNGRIRSGGVMANWQATRNLSVAARYIYSDSENVSPVLAGKTLPYVPTHFANLATYWQAGGRWLLGASGSFRSSRYADEGNVGFLDSGWGFGVKSYWETADKRLSLEMAASNLHADKSASAEQRARFSLNTTYRF